MEGICLFTYFVSSYSLFVLSIHLFYHRVSDHLFFDLSTFLLLFRCVTACSGRLSLLVLTAVISISAYDFYFVTVLYIAYVFISNSRIGSRANFHISLERNLGRLLTSLSRFLIINNVLMFYWHTMT